jgi:hypothetical protein
MATKGIAQFRGHIDLAVIQNDVKLLRQSLDSQKNSIIQTRRGLPRGWYRQSSPTVDLEVLGQVSSANNSVCLPSIWPPSLVHRLDR